MFKVPNGQDPYSAIGKYIREHIVAIEDIIAVIKNGDAITNQLFMVDMNEENYFIWKDDWWEGEKNVDLIDFFPVSEAINPSVQTDSIKSNDTINRQAAIEAIRKCRFVVDAIEKIKGLPSAQPEIIRCHQCGFWDRKTLRHQFNDFRDWNEAECLILTERDVYDEINRYTEADDFCSRAERRSDDAD